MGCGGSSPVEVNKGSFKATYFQKKRAFLSSKQARFVLALRRYHELAETVITLSDQPQTIMDHFPKLETSAEVLCNAELTKPLGEGLLAVVETVQPLIRSCFPTVEKIRGKAEKFRAEMGDFTNSLDETMDMLQDAEQGKVVDKTNHWLNACRLLEYIAY